VGDLSEELDRCRPGKRPRRDHDRSTCNLDADIKHVIDLAYLHFKCIVSTMDTFLEVSGEVDALVVKAVAKACEQSNIEVELGPVEAGLMRIVCSVVVLPRLHIKDQRLDMPTMWASEGHCMSTCLHCIWVQGFIGLYWTQQACNRGD